MHSQNSLQLHVKHYTKCSKCLTPINRVNSCYCTPCRTIYMRDYRQKLVSKMFNKITNSLSIANQPQTE